MHKRKVLMTVEDGNVWSYLQEDGEIAEIHCTPLYSKEEKSAPTLGNIYIGKVKNIAANIGAAFIEIQNGLNCYYDISQAQHAIFTDKRGKKPLCIGDELVVQINKEAVKFKAPTVTSNLSFTGRYAVLTHGNTRIGASGKLPKELREAYKAKLSEYKNENFGLIVRTNAGEVPFEKVLGEVESLKAEYEQILHTAKSRTCFSCLKSAPPAYIADLKNVYGDGLEEIVIENEDMYTSIYHFFEREQPEIAARLRLYTDKQLSLTNLYSTKTALEKATRQHVWLKNGGYLIIQPTEALTVIDVNSGKYTAKKKRSDAALAVNMEAAKEAARQIRLRNLSGIIIVDFINLESEEEQKMLLREFRHCLEQDPIQTTLVDVTPLQLVEVTRKKVRKPLHEMINEIAYNNTI